MYGINIRNCRGRVTLFGDHWSGVDDERGITDQVMLPNQYGNQEFRDDVANLVALLDAQTGSESEIAQARAERDSKRVTVAGYINGFISRVRTLAEVIVDTGVLSVLRHTVSPNDGVDTIGTVGSNVKTGWQKLLDITHPDLPNPLTLNGGITLEQFTTALDAMYLARDALGQALIKVKEIRVQRDNLLFNKLKPTMAAYRRKIMDLYPRDHPKVLSLPRLTPLPGSTPDAVNLYGSWNATDQMASLSWTACKHTDLDHYEIRACNEARYRTTEDIVVAVVTKDKLSYQTVWGLPVDGTTASYRVYAVTGAEHEKGSNPVIVTRQSATQEIAA